MKKDYQMPQCRIIKLAYSKSLLNETSTTEVPGGGSGIPDTSRQRNSGWDD